MAKTVRNLTANAGYLGLIPGLGRSPGEENSYPLQYSGLENPMDSMVQGVAKSGTRLKRVCDTQTVACQAPLSTGFCRQEYWSGSLFSSPGDLPNPGIKPMLPVSPALQADSLALSHKCILFIMNF